MEKVSGIALKIEDGSSRAIDAAVILELLKKARFGIRCGTRQA
jgi:L-asparaginase II